MINSEAVMDCFLRCSTFDIENIDAHQGPEREKLGSDFIYMVVQLSQGKIA